MTESSALVKNISGTPLHHKSCRCSKQVTVSADITWNGKAYIYFLDTKPPKLTLGVIHDITG